MMTPDFTPPAQTKSNKIQEARQRRDAMLAFGKKARDEMLSKSQGPNAMADLPIPQPAQPARPTATAKRMEAREGLRATIAHCRQQKQALGGSQQGAPGAFCSVAAPAAPAKGLRPPFMDTPVPFRPPTRPWAKAPADRSANMVSRTHSDSLEMDDAGPERRLSFGGPQDANRRSDAHIASSSGIHQGFSSISVMETDPPEPPKVVQYHTITQCAPFRDLSVEQFHWLEYMNQGASLWQHASSLQPPGPPATPVSAPKPSSSPSYCGSPMAVDRFQWVEYPEEDDATHSAVRHHSVTQCDAFRHLSLEQYHWLEYQAGGASLWQHTPAARQQCAAAPQGGTAASRHAEARQQRGEQKRQRELPPWAAATCAPAPPSANGGHQPPFVPPVPTLTFGGVAPQTAPPHVPAPPFFYPHPNPAPSLYPPTPPPPPPKTASGVPYAFLSPEAQRRQRAISGDAPVAPTFLSQPSAQFAPPPAMWPAPQGPTSLPTFIPPGPSASISDIGALLASPFGTHPVFNLPQAHRSALPPPAPLPAAPPPPVLGRRRGFSARAPPPSAPSMMHILPGQPKVAHHAVLLSPHRSRPSPLSPSRPPLGPLSPNLLAVRSTLCSPSGKRKRDMAMGDDAEGHGYYTWPSESWIQKATGEELSNVANLEVGRAGIGTVQFLEPVDIRGVRLEEAVRIEEGSVCIYPSDAFPEPRPPAGQGLNRLARCTLFNVWPKRRAMAPSQAFVARLRAVPNTVFEEYDGELGRWTFCVRGGDWY